jgi:hypothetical protein
LAVDARRPLRPLLALRASLAGLTLRTLRPCLARLSIDAVLTVLAVDAGWTDQPWQALRTTLADRAR